MPFPLWTYISLLWLELRRTFTQTLLLHSVMYTYASYYVVAVYFAVYMCYRACQLYVNMHDDLT